jgi:CubicO group peptidase (beta-lactamase class C family)
MAACKLPWRILNFASLLCFSALIASADAADFEWQVATPQSQGMSQAKLDALRDRIASTTKALLVVRNDHIVYEWYAEGHSADKTHFTASMAKAVVGGVSCAVAMTDGKIALDDLAAKYIKQWQNDPQKSKITIRQLGSHTSGLEDSSVEGLSHTNEPGWKGEFWKRLDPPNDPFTISREKTPVVAQPGTKWAYSNPGIALLTYAVTVAIQDGPQKDVRTLLNQRIMRPIGVTDKEWSIGYGQTYVVDGMPMVGSWGGGGYTARAAARVGRLMLREGDWDGQQLISKEAVQETTRDAGTPGPNGIGWWSNNDEHFPKLPKDAYWGAGAGNQILLVVPSLNLIAVRNGADLAGAKSRDAVNAFLFEPLMAAVINSKSSRAAPYPQSKLIRSVEWAPKETIVRKAKGGDNWPITWADDDRLYSAYGDANGFEPFLKEKLSMGLVAVEGTSGDFCGTNIRSSSFETKGEGAKGRKASGMLMVDGTLYVLVRNVGNAQLGWSNDHGQTWTWSDWKFDQSFGCPTFLNFGKNYAGARDEYVYVYSHDSNSAYEPADGVVLARVPQQRIKDQAAYEYLVRLDALGAPLWTKSIADRRHVFTNPGGCYRMSLSYNAGLKRYLMCQIVADKSRDSRFDGGFGIYESQEPWGPWATVYYTNTWDVGPGETNSLPTKWMSADGQTVHLVFSGDDCFSVRQAKLIVGNDEYRLSP